MEKITVIGIGRLGICTALCFESKGYDVTGVDVNSDYITSLNEKTFTSPEPRVNSYLRQSKNFKATTNLKEGLDHSDIIFIIVPTPTLKNSKSYDHSILINLLIDINNFRVENKLLVITSTVMPGFTTKIAKFAIRDCKNTSLSYNPEFIAQGTIMSDFINSPLVLIGEEDKNSGDILSKIYEKVSPDARVCRMSIESAEITKIGLNCFVTTKIAFANFIGDVADKTEGANKDDILFAIGSDPRIGTKCLKAGFGYGGPCFPRDNRALEHYANSKGITPFIPVATDQSNRFHTQVQYEEFDKQTGTIVFENVGYKDNCVVPIIEESQKLIIANRLADNHKVVLVDHDVILDEIKKKEEYKNKFTYVSKNKPIHKIFISHYTKLKDRHSFMSQQISESKLNDLAPVQWVDFFDREKITEQQIKENYVYNPVICQRPLTIAEIANYLGHYHCIEQIANDVTLLSGMIIEDDMVFKKDYVRNLECAFEIVPNDWDIIVVGGAFYYGIDCTLKDQYSDPQKFIMYSPSDYQTPTGNYIIKKETAKRILKSGLMKPFSLPIDDILWRTAKQLKLNVYWCRPWLSVEGSKNGKYESVAGRGF